MGFEVQTVVNGLQALMMAGRSHPDVLIVDINMPEVDGLSVCLRLLSTQLPRFRALALFGRRPPERVVRPSSRHPKTCTKPEVAGPHSITSSAIGRMSGYGLPLAPPPQALPSDAVS
jgi:CheY-like chemotaxis protein